MPGACDLTTGYSFTACATGVAGASELFIMPYDYVLTIAITAGVVSAITKTTGQTFKQYKFKRDLAMFTDNGTKEVTNGTQFYTPHFEASILGWTSAMRSELDLVAANSLILIVKKRDGTYWLAGRDKGMDMLSWSAESGKAIGDFNGQNLVFEGKEAFRSVEVPSTLIAALLV